MLLAMVILAAPPFAGLPVYPGAERFVSAQIQEASVRTYLAPTPAAKVARWYAAQLRLPLERRSRDDAKQWVVAARKVRLGGFNYVLNGVVIWGKPGGSSWILLIDRAMPSGTIKDPRSRLAIPIGPDAKVKKPKPGSDPDRYRADPLRGRSPAGRSVEGSFR
jgi:hypothetical protein